MSRRYGLTPQDYNFIYNKQEGRCFLCGRHALDIKKNRNRYALHIDHDHKTGDIRGLLCIGCNRALGTLGDDLSLIVEKILKYIKYNKELKEEMELSL